MSGLAVPIPYQWQVGDTGNAALLNAQVFNGLKFQLNPPTAIMTVTTPQAAVATGAAAITAVAFDTTATDNYGGHSTTVNNSRYTAQVAGTYWVRAAVCWTPNATGSRTMQLFVNGGGVPYAQVQLPAAPASTYSLVEVTCLVPMNAGDYLEFKVGQNTGANLAIVAAGTVMQVLRVSN